MSELKTCPKCGDDVKGYVTGGIAAFGCGEYGFDVDCGCGISYSTGCVYETPEEARGDGLDGPGTTDRSARARTWRSSASAKRTTRFSALAAAQRRRSRTLTTARAVGRRW